MRVEAVKVAEGFLIPFEEGLQDVAGEKILLEIEFIESPPKEEDYTALDQLTGLCETKDTTASVDHDSRIYRRQPPP